MRATQLAREGSQLPGLRLHQAKLLCNSNQIARARIRRFESDMPSQAVGSLWPFATANKTSTPAPSAYDLPLRGRAASPIPQSPLLP
jgi:hypothetical protein